MNPENDGDYHFPNGVYQTHQTNNRNGYTGQGHLQRSTCQGHSARHPDYVDRSNRLLSYSHWPFSHVQDPTTLSNYGFFYTGEGDLVRCFSCSLGLKDFISTDDPLREHVKYSAETCEFLIQLLGPSRLREIKANLEINHAPRNTSELQQRLQNGTLSDTQQTQSASNKRTTEVQSHRHPEYKSFSVRVSSYVGWPTHLFQTPQKLAEAGFYYTGTRDVVRCWSCDGGLQKWIPTDDPWIEHCLNFSSCLFLRETKGEDYIALALLHHGKKKNTAPVQNGLNQTYGNLQFKEEVKDEKHGKEVQKFEIQVVGMGYAQEDVSRAVDTLTKEKKEVTVECIVDEIERNRSEVKLEPKDVFKEHQLLKAQLYCMDCKTRDINTLFLPCQHHRLCSECSENFTLCPVCGRNIDHKIKTYRP